ncbi:hypothetical protein GCM10012275_17260 [Longimycelium tulufanense]|uniref:Uncharacterized protein n=1 Tax=Longimycelium tulufanense TaxID=907463 RepID=A0A8J3CB02_9PSEU|nr:hypothetical protein GCM10012275_17260 [Longimycelium tulufanense]
MDGIEEGVRIRVRDTGALGTVMRFHHLAVREDCPVRLDSGRAVVLVEFEIEVVEDRPAAAG